MTKHLSSKELQELVNEASDVYFTSDTHVGSERTLSLSRRPFADVDEMDLAITTGMTNRLQDTDLLIHLGDVGDFDLNVINAKVVLLKGNHDRGTYKTNVDTISSGTEVRLNGLLYRLVHEPNEVDTTTLPRTDDVFYLYGHTHKLNMVKRNGLNIGTDCHDYQPINIKAIEFYRTAILSFYDDNVFSEICTA